MNFGYVHNEKYAKFSKDSLGKKIASGMNFKPQFVVIAFLWLFIEQKCSNSIAITFYVQNLVFIPFLCFFRKKTKVNCRSFFMNLYLVKLKNCL